MTIDRTELARWLREQDYALVTREQAARMERMAHSGAVPWDEHRRVLAAADAELAELRARIVELERGRGALLQACTSIERIAQSEGDMALDTDDIRALLADGALADGSTPCH